MGDGIPLHGPALHFLCLYSGFEAAISFYFTEKVLANMPKNEYSEVTKSLVLPCFMTVYEFYHTKTYPYGR